MAEDLEVESTEAKEKVLLLQKELEDADERFLEYTLENNANQDHQAQKATIEFLQRRVTELSEELDSHKIRLTPLALPKPNTSEDEAKSSDDAVTLLLTQLNARITKLEDATQEDDARWPSISEMAITVAQCEFR